MLAAQQLVSSLQEDGLETQAADEALQLAKTGLQACKDAVQQVLGMLIWPL